MNKDNIRFPFVYSELNCSQLLYVQRNPEIFSGYDAIQALLLRRDEKEL